MMHGNPFATFLSSGVYLPHGHEEILAEIAGVITLAEPEARELRGLPGTGKSSLLRYIDSDAFITDYAPHFLGDFKKSPQRLFIVYITGWIESIDPYVLLYREYLDDYRPYYEGLSDMSLPEPPAADMDGVADVADDDPDRAIALMEPHLRRLHKAGIRTVLLLDDFDSDLAYRRFDAEQTARLSSWAANCSLIVATERRLERVNTASAGSPFFKHLPGITFRDMLPAEAADFVRGVLRLGGADLHDDDIRYLVSRAGGFRYLLLLAGRALWERRRRLGLGSSPDDPLPRSAHAFLDHQLLVEFGRMFEQYFNGLDDDQRRLLADLARGSDYAAGEGDARPHAGRLSELELLGLVDVNAAGEPALFSPLFVEFLRNDGRPAAPTPPPPAAPRPKMTRLQAALYEALRRRPGELLTFAELGEQVWGWPIEPGRELDKDDIRRIHLAASKLRGVLDASGTGEQLVNLRGRGYKLEAN